MTGELLPAYSAEVLEAAPARATKFLQGMGALPIVRTQLAQAGMTDADVEEGRKLLLDCLAQPRAPSATFDTEDAKRQRAAIAELNAWDEPNFARFAAALKRRAPDAHQYVFGDVAASRSPDEAVRAIATFLSRVEALEKGSDPARAASAADDKKVVELLQTRGLTPGERVRLRELVDVALGPTRPLDVLPPAEPDDVRLEKLGKLRAWYDEWADTARALVRRRSDLIRLGLAQRRSPKKVDEDDGDEDVTPAPAGPSA